MCGSLCFYVGWTAGTTGMDENTNWNDPANSIPWRLKQRSTAESYLKRQDVGEFRLRMEPEFELAPYISLWYAEPERWVIAGDLPTDHFDLPRDSDFREAIFGFSLRWKRAAKNMVKGRPNPGWSVGDPANASQQRELGLVLLRRAKLLSGIALQDMPWWRRLFL